ncbi:hypothetical protein [Bacillus rubiinfantis]|uniref:hypothetical protein n=1 Tax=Bacillus rubiinfantis TaxID=1499680 RepID=UPI0005A9F5D0|nr:hypothetical protein [Bacillus rubiinfantis]
MFDPTAFDNMKVVLEGALYDYDLNREIIITDRNDLINMAKMLRLFNICFSLPHIQRQQLSAKIELESKLENFTAELLSGSNNNPGLAGCYLKLQFFIIQKNEQIHFETVQNLFSQIWGSTRKITQSVQYNPLDEQQTITNTITIDFGRLITENQMDDLIEIIAVMITSLEEAYNYFSKHP